MVTLSFVFWMFMLLFGTIGAMRGWGKELLVSFSIILALFVIQVVQAYVPPVAKVMQSSNPEVQFYVWASLITAFALFGYHTPNLHKMTNAKLMARDRLQDILLGGVLGMVNGYLLVGTIWFYLDMAEYPFPQYISAPEEGTVAGDAALKIISLLPPTWLGVPIIYFAVAVAFTFVVIVFI